MTVGESDSSVVHPEPSRADIWKMFDRVARRYDLLNRLLSMGIDCAWRKKVASLLPPGGGHHVLDLATGTADQILFLFEKSDKITSGLGLDLAERMLEVGRRKIENRGLSEAIRLETGDAMDIPVEDEQFNVVTISFGIRNLIHVPTALLDMFRVLKPGGRVLVLEFSLPERPWMRKVYLFYLRHILPRIGSFVSGDAQAYRYLNETIETFPHGDAFCRLLTEAGFGNVRAHPLSFGIATIYQGDKP